MVLVFDYDGTIHDTKRLYGSTFRNAYDDLVKAGYAAEQYSTQIGRAYSDRKSVV